jgi:choline dehydrogenase-like flavoprotein
LFSNLIDQGPVDGGGLVALRLTRDAGCSVCCLNSRVINADRVPFLIFHGLSAANLFKPAYHANRITMNNQKKGSV